MPEPQPTPSPTPTPVPTPAPSAEPPPAYDKPVFMKLADGKIVNVTGRPRADVLAFKKQMEDIGNDPTARANLLFKWNRGAPQQQVPSGVGGQEPATIGSKEPAAPSELQMGIDEVIHRANPIEIMKGFGKLVTTNPLKTAENVRKMQEAILIQGEKDVEEGRVVMGRARQVFGHIPIAGAIANDVATAVDEGHYLKALGILAGEGLAAFEAGQAGKLGNAAAKGLGKAGRAVYESAIPAMEGVTTAQRAAMVERGLQKGASVVFGPAGNKKLAALEADLPDVVQKLADAEHGASLSPGEMLKSFDAEREAAMATLPKGGIRKVEEAVGRKTVSRTRTAGETTPSDVVSSTTSKGKSVKKGKTTTSAREAETIKQGSTAKRSGETITETEVIPGKPATVLTEAEQKVADQVAAIEDARSRFLDKWKTGGKGAVRNVSPGEAAEFGLRGGEAPSMLRPSPDVLIAQQRITSSVMDAVRNRFPKIDAAFANSATEGLLRKAILKSMEDAPGGVVEAVKMIAKGRALHLLNQIVATPAVRTRLGIVLAKMGRGANRLEAGRALAVAFSGDLQKMQDQQDEAAAQAPQ